MSIQTDLDRVVNLLERMIVDAMAYVNGCGCSNQKERKYTESLLIEAEQMITLIKGK